MEKVFSSLVVQFREFYKQLSPIKRMSLLGAIFISMLALFVMTLMVSGTDYKVLLTNIPADQLAIVVDQLKKKNVPFKLKDGGKTVTIPEELLHATQMAIMAEVGSSQIGNTGLEVFDKESFGTSSYVQRVNYQRALQGELMRSINSLEAVKQSKVILALPAKKTFLEDGGDTSASIVLELYSGKRLTEDQVSGIRFLVSSAVQGLDVGKVTVVDGGGKVLTRQMDAASSMSSDLIDLKRKIEQNLVDRVESILSKVVGQERVIAKVDVTLDPRQMQVVEETVDPDKTAIASSVIEAENLNGARTNPAGVPGARANLPGAQNAGQVGFNQNVKKELKTTNFSVPKKVTNMSQVAGSIQRVSVAVLVDGEMKTITGEDGRTQEEWKPWPPEKIAQYESLVKSAIGFNNSRGDKVKIESIQFQKEGFEEAEQLLSNLERKKLLHALFKWTLLGLSLGLFFFVVIRPFMQWITESFQDSVDDMLPRTIEELEELQAIDNTLPGMTDALPTLEQSIDPDKAESELLRGRILDIVNKDDEKASGAFSLWLSRRES